MKIKSSFLVFVARAVFTIESYVIHIILGHFLNPIEYGVWGVVFNLLNIFRNVLNNGLPQTLTKLVAENIENAFLYKKRILKLGTILGVAFGIIFYFSADPIASLMNDPSIGIYLRLVSILIPSLTIFSIYLGALTGMKSFGSYAFIIIFYQIIQVLMVYIPLELGYGLLGALIGYIVSTLLILILTIIITDRKISSKLVNLSQEIKITTLGIFKSAGPLSIFVILLNILMTADLLFVKRTYSDSPISGYYNVATTLSKFPYYLYTSIAITLLPNIASKIKTATSEKVNRLIQNNIEILLYMMVPALAIISINANEIIPLMYPREYLPSADILKYIIFGFGFHTLNYVLVIALFAKDNVTKPLYAITLALISSFIINGVFIPIYGINTAIFVCLFIPAAMSIYFFRLVIKEYGKIINVAVYLKIGAITASISIAAYLIKVNGILAIIECGILYCISIIPISRDLLGQKQHE